MLIKYLSSSLEGTSLVDCRFHCMHFSIGDRRHQWSLLSHTCFIVYFGHDSKMLCRAYYMYKIGP